AEPGPWYVTAVDAGTNRLVVGRREELGATRVKLEDVRFVGRPPVGPLACEARLRYHARPLPAVYEAGTLDLAEPFPGPAPGQAASAPPSGARRRAAGRPSTRPAARCGAS